jgi:hypothetical protein
MSYTYDLSPAASFEDRSSQFIAFGIPKADVDTLRATIKDMWADAPGGWSRTSWRRTWWRLGRAVEDGGSDRQGHCLAARADWFG